jgi:hypothetical protein
MRPRLQCHLVLAWAVAAGQAVLAQQVTIETPYNALSEGFFENFGTSWGLRGPNWNLSVFGSPTQAAPAFGGFDPSAGANFGTAFRRDGLSGYFAANYSQGSRRTFTTQAPKVTLQNGYPGAVFDTSTSPFVISNIPVVGGYPTMGFPTGGAVMGYPAVGYTPPVMGYPAVGYTPPVPGYVNRAAMNRNPAVQHSLRRAMVEQQAARNNTPAGVIQQGAADAAEGRAQPPRRAGGGDDDLVLGVGTAVDSAPAGSAGRAAAGPSSATRPAPSVAEARRAYEAEAAQKNDGALGYVERARNAEANGKTNVAKIYYQMAYRRASGELKGEILERLRSLGNEP